MPTRLQGHRKSKSSSESTCKSEIKTVETMRVIDLFRMVKSLSFALIKSVVRALSLKFNVNIIYATIQVRKHTLVILVESFSHARVKLRYTCEPTLAKSFSSAASLAVINFSRQRVM